MNSTTHLLCPVKIWKTIVLRIFAYPGTNLTSTVNTILINSSTSFITSKVTPTHIRHTITIIGFDKFGFHAEDAGNHSIRLSFAMFLYLNHIRSDRIMLQGRRLSQAVLTYIRPQVSAFSARLSEKMMENGSFYTVPDNTATCSTFYWISK